MLEKITPPVKAAIITVSFLAFSSIIGIAYTIGKAHGEKNLEQLKTFKDADIPQLLINLDKISKVIVETINFHDKYDLCLRENNAIKNNLTKKDDKISELEKSLMETSKLFIDFNNQISFGSKYQDTYEHLLKELSIKDKIITSLNKEIEKKMK